MSFSEIKVGDILVGTAIKKKETYALLLFEDGVTGLLHRKEMPRHERRPFHDFIQIGALYKAKVIEKDEEKGGLRVSMRALTPEERRTPLPRSLPKEGDVSFQGLENALRRWCGEDR